MACRWYLAWPFSNVNWAWDIMPFYDVYILAGWIVLLLVHLWRKLPLMRTAKLGLAVFLAVFALRAAGKLRAEALAERLIAAQPAAAIRTLPVCYQPWIWYVLSPGAHGVRTPVNILTGEVVPPTQVIRPKFPPLPREIRNLRRRRRG